MSRPSPTHLPPWAPVFAALACLVACRNPAATEGRACYEEGKADACASLAARQRTGDGAPRDLAHAEALDRRAAELRERACMHGDNEACAKLHGR